MTKSEINSLKENDFIVREHYYKKDCFVILKKNNGSILCMNIINRFNRTFKNSLKNIEFKLVTSKNEINICKNY